MNKQLAKIFGVLVGTLAIMGLLINGRLFDLLNSDMSLDILRATLAANLLYASFMSREAGIATTALLVTGVFYLGISMMGVISPSLGGVLPSGLTGFDIAFHLVTGTLALLLGMHKDERYTLRA